MTLRITIRMLNASISILASTALISAIAVVASATEPETGPPENDGLRGIVELPSRHESNVPVDVMDTVTELDHEYDPVSLVWDDEDSLLTIWVDPKSDISLLNQEISAKGLKNEITVRHAAHSEDDLVAAAESAVTSTVAGSAVAWAAPNADGSGLELGLESDPRVRVSTDTRVDGIPASVVEIGETEPVSRDVDYEPFIAGADMSTPAAEAGTIHICTSAFALVGLNHSTGLWEEQIFTADHCIRNKPSTTWRTGWSTSNAPLGTRMFAPSSAGSDIGKIRGQTYDPYMYIGPNTSNTAAVVRGHWAPVINAYVHYSGARSGTVYSNLITQLNVTAGYGYSNLVRTEQIDGDPAVGHGDSGGPVFAVGTDGSALATGIISGISGGTTTCAGDPGEAGPDGRKCSPSVLYAPLSAYFELNPNDALQTG